MSAPSVGAKDILVAAGVGSFEGTPNNLWPIYISKLPDKPDNCIALYDSGGAPPDPRWLLDYPDISVMVRGQTYLECFNKARDVRSALLGLTSQDVNGDRWDSVTLIGDIADLGRDSLDRPMRSMTFRLIVEPAPSLLDIRVPL